MQEQYGIDWGSPSGVDHDTIVVPNTECPLSAAELTVLRQTVDPMEECDDYGIGLYTITRAFVYSV